jgi:transmembrane 9 superfamily protein 2/4
LLFPGLAFCLVLILNLFVWAQASSTAIPFSTLIGLLALWLLIQVPLVYLGSWVGYVRAAPWEHPLKTNAIPRQIPPQPWYLRSPLGPLLTGLIPFAVLFIELLFVFKNLWQDKTGYYYVFGFLSAVSTVLMVTVVEVTVIATYSQLCSEVRRPSAFEEIHADLLELSLVVAKFPHWWQQRILDLCLLYLVLPVQAPRHRICVQLALLQL